MKTRSASVFAAMGLAVAMTLSPVGARTADAQDLTITGVQLEDVAFDAVNGVLTAGSGTVEGTLAGLPFTTDIEDFELAFRQGPGRGRCAILNLELAPIELALLGLHVDTSPICLRLFAIPNGGLLGDLLCSLSGLGLDDLLGALEGGLLGTILEESLGGALNNARRGMGNGEDSVCSGDCEVLHLALGPVNLALLGLVVQLDDCDRGRVQVCVSATADEGLLGSLLCSLAGPLLGGLDLSDITELVDLAQELLADDDLSADDILQLVELLNMLLSA